jgi:hypothetical protein
MSALPNTELVVPASSSLIYHYRLGQKLFMYQKYTQAIDHFKSSGTNDAEACYWISKCYHQLKDTDRHLKYLKEAALFHHKQACSDLIQIYKHDISEQIKWLCCLPPTATTYRSWWVKMISKLSEENRDKNLLDWVPREFLPLKQVKFQARRHEQLKILLMALQHRLKDIYLIFIIDDYL